MVTWKLKVNPQVLASLWSAIRNLDPRLVISEVQHPKLSDAQLGNTSFVTILPGDRNFDGEQTEIMLALKEETWQEVPRDSEHREFSSSQVTRDKIDGLLDILGIFPTSGEKKPPINQAMDHLQAAREIFAKFAKDIPGDTDHDLRCGRDADELESGATRLWQEADRLKKFMMK